MLDKIFKGGTIVTDRSTFRADVGVTGEKITEIAKTIKPDKGTEVIDCRGKLILPGAIDAHTHLAMPFGGTISADDYETGTRAAASGGTTTVFDFILQDFGEPFPKAIKRRNDIAKKQAVVDYSFHLAVKDVKGKLLDSMEDAVKAGVPSFKVFMVYDFGVTDGVFYQVLERSKKIGALIGVHAENNDMVNYFTEQFAKEKTLDPYHHYLSRPEFVEKEADERAIAWAKSLNAPLYIVHLANDGGMKAVKKARAKGYPIFAETCPQYLNFTKEVYTRKDGRNFVCSPPMKGKKSQDALWSGIKTGDIATIATDHCPFKQKEKDWGKDDFRKIPNGCAGIENMYPYVLSEANKGRITFKKAVELCSTNVAKIFGLSNKKGAIEVGRDADIVVYDRTKNYTIRNRNMHGNTDHTIWEGAKLKGYPIRTYSRGRLVYKDGKFLSGNAPKGSGEFVKCKPIKITTPDISNMK
ncbi:MAG: dihydropyrimidinase [Clostridiales Family XIII bacterium]|jgi:dihydropyrimidinase|nr:dihydropyrimidinase [Clostridiales Family XIII bacterium]